MAAWHTCCTVAADQNVPVRPVNPRVVAPSWSTQSVFNPGGSPGFVGGRAISMMFVSVLTFVMSLSSVFSASPFLATNLLSRWRPFVVSKVLSRIFAGESPCSTWLLIPFHCVTAVVNAVHWAAVL
ncbi:hypothetical protein C8R46DRAFT_1096724 [Mycena filopes]|nr:hypothetical protein C8R46DRAFT_1096724 [Mycena filopes]